MKEKHLIIHVFNEYLPPTQMWLADLLDQLNHENILFAKKYNGFKTGNKLIRSQTSRSKNNLISKLKRRFTEIGNSELVGEINEVYEQNLPQIIHAHFADIACDIMQASCLSKVPFIVSFYGWDYEMLPYTKPKYKIAYAKLFDKVDYIITEGPHGMRILNEIGCPKSKIKVIPLGIKITKPTIKLKRSSTVLKLVQIASLREKKGQIYSIKALAKCLNNGIEAKLTLIGDHDSDYGKAVIQLIKDLGIEASVDLKGFINYDLIQSELSQYDVFIQPSCYAENRDCEGGAPTTLFHAMHQGLPIIGSKHCDIPFLVKDKFNGLLADEKDINGLAKLISEFAKMPDNQFHQYSTNTNKQVIQYFDIAKNSQILDKLYLDIINNI